MKYILKTAVVLLGGLFMNSCSSNEDGINPVVAQTTHKVKVNASGFSTSQESMTRKTTENKLEDHVSKIHYFVMKQMGSNLGVVKIEEQQYDYNPENFGTMTFDLENGEYTIFVIGQQKNELGEYVNVDFNEMRPFLNYSYRNLVGDLFLSKQTIVVDNGDIAANFTLERMVGQLEVKITDAIPAGTDHIDVMVLNELGDYYFAIDDMYGASRGRIYSTKINSADIGSTSFSRKLFVLKTGGPIVHVEIRAYDADGEVIASRSKEDVEIQRNQKATLTSSDFFRTPVTPIPSSDLTVEVNAVWEDIPVQEF